MAHQLERSREEESNVEPVELLELLGDEYTRRVLEAVADQPRSGTAVATAASVSKATAFRRLNRLEEAGLVETHPSIDLENGHHHTLYRASFDGISLEIRSGDLSVAIE